MQEKQNRRPFILCFLYPLNRMGIGHIGLFTFFLGLLFLVRSVLYNVFGPIAMYIVEGLYLVNFLIGAEVFFYIISCVRESAAGAAKAPDSLFSGTFDVGDWRDIIQDFMTTAAPYIFCFCPSFVYLASTQRTDWIYFSLLILGISYFPMFLLAVILFDSSSGFNPLTHIISIIVTFIPYCILIAQFFFLIACFYGVGLAFENSPVSYLISLPCMLYFIMLLAHLLGRFYYLNQDKLNWDV